MPKHNAKQPTLPGVNPVERKYVVTLSLTQAQSNAIHIIRTEEYHNLVPFATLTTSLLAEALMERHRIAEARKGAQ
jgi:hypothetical protein